MSIRIFSTGRTWAAADTVGTTYTINAPTGYRFRAFFIQNCGANNETTSSVALNIRACYGFATSTSSRRCVGMMSVDAAGSADCQEIYRDDAVLATVDATGVVDGLLDVTTFSDTQIILTVDDQVPASQHFYIHIIADSAGEIENVAVGEITEPAATGVQSYAPAGWVASHAGSNAVLFAGCQLTGAAPDDAVQDAGIMFGAATGTGAGNQFVFAYNEDDGSASADSDRYGRGDECLAMMAVAGGNPNARASFNGFTSTGFDLNWVARAVTNRRYIYLAIQGGSWQCGNYLIDTTTIGNTATVSGLNFTPMACLQATHNGAENAAGSSSTEGWQSVGHFGWDDTLSQFFRRGQGFWSVNGAGNMDLAVTQNVVSVLHYRASAAEVCSIDLDTGNNDGFTMIVDAIGTVASVFVGYIACGDNIDSSPSSTLNSQCARLRR